MRWWPTAFHKLGVPFTNVNGVSLTDCVEQGSVLDAHGTNYWKARQMARIITKLYRKEIKDGDTIFFHDLWFPGLEMLAYIRDITGVNFLIKGIFHAGTWDFSDFTSKAGMTPWAKHIEKGWLHLVDEIFVATKFHKRLILTQRNAGEPQFDPDKIKVTGIPFVANEVKRPQAKENIVVFPHRLDMEKQPILFDRLAELLCDKYPDWEFVKSKDVCNSKEEYFQLLGKSKIAVSFATQETFGYAMMEAMANGCWPVVPNRLSYATMTIYEGHRWDSFSGILMAVARRINNWTPFNNDSDLAEYDTDLIVKRMKF